MQNTYPSPTLPDHRTRRRGTDFLIIWACLTILALPALFAAWQFWHADRIFTGVRVAGLEVGGLSRSAALTHLERELSPFPITPVVVHFEDRQWVLTSESLTPRPDFMDAVNRAYLSGRQEGLIHRIGEQWSALIGQINVQPKLTYDPGNIRYELSRIASEVRRPGRAAVEAGERTLPSRPGIDVDIDGTARLLFAALDRQGAEISIPLQTIGVVPPDGGQLQVDVEAIASREPLILRDLASDLDFALDPAALTRIAPDGNTFDPVALRAIVTEWAEKIRIEPQDARLRFDPAIGGPVVIQPSIRGRRLDTDQTILAVQQALNSGVTEIALPIEEITPAVDSTRLNEMGIRELVAAGTTYYAGSSLARIRNIEVAASKFEGVVIPPNGIFSFNSIVEGVSAANGFEDSLIIWGDRTAVGVGGGVCQVSTTVFRAALNAGFPIVERYNHGYVVSWYGDPGMDATIYTPSVDFRFRNDTNAHLLVQPAVDSAAGIITFNFYGTRPQREVIIGEPQISDVVEPDPPIYREDESMVTGQVRQVEFAQTGMTVTVERRVSENGETRVDEIRSVYQPWSAVYLVGPGTPVPNGARSEPLESPSTETG